MPKGGAFQQARELVEANLSGVKQKLIVLSGKGGVGKTALSVNIAVTLADTGRSVCLLDTDIHGHNVLRLLNLQGRMPDVKGARIVPLPFSDRLSVVSAAKPKKTAITFIMTAIKFNTITPMYTRRKAPKIITPPIMHAQ